MHARYVHKGLTWVDLESPTREEVRSIAEEFNIDVLVAEELLLPSTKPQVEFHERYAYVILHFPALRHSHTRTEQEMDFVIGKNFIVTTRYDMIDPLHKFSKVFEVNSTLDKSLLGDHAMYVFFFMMKKLYKSVEHEVEGVVQDLYAIEQHLFSGHEVDMVAAISRSARDLLNLRQTLEPHRDVIKTLETDGPAFFGNVFASCFRTLSNEYYRAHNQIVRNVDILHELRETNNSLLSTKENETMRMLTIMAVLTFPLALLVGILNIESPYNPLKGTPYDFWITVGILITIAGSMFLYFKHKKWL